MQTSPRVDAHHHVWDLTQRDQEWTIGLPALRRSFSMDDLVPQLKECGVVATVVVQTVNLAEETPELLCLAEECSWIVGVVGWVDLRAPSVRDQLDELSQLPGGEHLVGIRHVVQSELDPNWLRHPNNLRGLRAVWSTTC
jgi:L-fuconolactonase